MPAFNAGNYIENAVDSVLNQTYPNWELIIIDDGSTDDTLNIISEISKVDKRIFILKNKVNLGVSATRNKGVKFANYDWIAFLDSDDLWAQDKLDKQVEMIKHKNASFIFTSYTFMNTEGIYYKGVFEAPQVIDYKQLRKQNVINTSSVLTKKKYLEDFPMEQDNMHEDFATWLRILKKYGVAHSVKEPLTVYRISRDSKSGNKIKSVIMTFKVFRFVGLNFVQSIYFTFSHVMKSFRKYSRLSMK